MYLKPEQREALKRDLVACLSSEPEVTRIVIFGSFLDSDRPDDMDVAVFENSGERYLPLALKYRKRARPVSRRIPLDIIPIREHAPSDAFLKEIESGEVVYER